MHFDFLSEQIVGIDSTFDTPFGQQLMVYCDYTASGRCLKFIEQYIMKLQRNYANTHTEDDVTGRNMTKLLHKYNSLACFDYATSAPYVKIDMNPPKEQDDEDCGDNCIGCRIISRQCGEGGQMVGKISN